MVIPLSRWHFRAAIELTIHQRGKLRAWVPVRRRCMAVAILTDDSRTRTAAGLGALLLAMGPLVREKSYESAVGGGIDWSEY